MKISVIVPVYKSEPYIRRCLDSVIGQTYRDLEIILIDDGSPDNCGAICDEYAEKDNRIKVIHKENGGVSSARNAGLAVAKGEWIGWVDSDDWIETDMYAYMIKHAAESNADIAVCSRFEEHRACRVFRGYEREEVLDTEQALKLLLKNDVMQNFLHDKLWRRELFNDLVFPERMTFEDVAVVYKLFMRAKCIICLPEAKYHYFLHQGSITADTSLQNKICYYIAAKRRYDEMRYSLPQFSDLLTAQCVVSAVSIWSSYYHNPRHVRRQFREQLREIASFCREHVREALQNMKLGPSGRAILRLTPYVSWWAFSLAAFFSRLYSIKHGRAL